MLSGGKVVVFWQVCCNISLKNVGRFFLSKFVFGYFETKKKREKNVPLATKLEGRGGVRPFLRLPLVSHKKETEIKKRVKSRDKERNHLLLTEDDIIHKNFKYKNIKHKYKTDLWTQWIIETASLFKNIISNLRWFWLIMHFRNFVKRKKKMIRW